MCAIAGILDLKNRSVDASVLKQMTDVQKHRGPDGEGFFIEKNVGLGHRRLSILDLSDAGVQPMLNAKKSVALIHNGEIYNYLELKRKLPKRNYKSGTDTEVMLHAYDVWGEKAIKEFNGIFAFALWDRKKKILFAARDRLGVKPFYYAIHNNTFYFASEIKALLVAGVPARPNKKIIYEYLSSGFYDHSNETFFKNIYQLMPGYTLTIKKGMLAISQYWYLPDELHKVRFKKDSEYADAFLDLVKKSIQLQLRSDVPIGMSVSGGLDSSLLTGVVNDVVKGQKNLNLFHFGYGSEKNDIEASYVRMLAKRLGWNDPFFEFITASDMSRLFNVVMHHEEQPFPGAPTFAWHKLYKRISESDTVVTFEGHGGDEFAAGYDYFESSYILDLIHSNGPHKALTELEKFAHVRSMKPNELLSFFLNGIAAATKGGVSADASRFASDLYLSNRFKKAYSQNQIQFQKPFDSYLTNMQYRELTHTKLPRVLRSVDRESMAFSRELRVPLLDHRIVEFAFSLPLNQRIRNGHMRYFMRNAAMKYLPKELARTPKRSVPMPQREWSQKELKPWITSILTSPSFKAREYFNQREVIKEYNRFCREKNPKNAFHIWQWVSIEMWHRAFID
jgi:asparagine synthase (glutamine-hydrolysing)